MRTVLVARKAIAIAGPPDSAPINFDHFSWGRLRDPPPEYPPRVTQLSSTTHLPIGNQGAPYASLERNRDGTERVRRCLARPRRTERPGPPRTADAGLVTGCAEVVPRLSQRVVRWAACVFLPRSAHIRSQPRRGSKEPGRSSPTCAHRRRQAFKSPPHCRPV